MGKKEFAAATLNLEHKTFIVYIASFLAILFSCIPLDIDIYPFYRSQIAGLIAIETFIKVSPSIMTLQMYFLPTCCSNSLSILGLTTMLSN